MGATVEQIETKTKKRVTLCRHVAYCKEEKNSVIRLSYCARKQTKEFHICKLLFKARNRKKSKTKGKQTIHEDVDECEWNQNYFVLSVRGAANVQ